MHAPTLTEYKNVVFRSKSEAVFARFIDILSEEISSWMKLSWLYEPDTHHPDVHQWDFEVMAWSQHNEIDHCRTLIEYKPSPPTETYHKNLLRKITPSVMKFVFGNECVDRGNRNCKAINALVNLINSGYAITSEESIQFAKDNPNRNESYIELLTEYESEIKELLSTALRFNATERRSKIMTLDGRVYDVKVNQIISRMRAMNSFLVWGSPWKPTEWGYDAYPLFAYRFGVFGDHKMEYLTEMHNPNICEYLTGLDMVCVEHIKAMMDEAAKYRFDLVHP